MRRTVLLSMFALIYCSYASAEISFDMDALKKLSSRFPFAVLLHENDEKRFKFIYSDVVNHVHIYTLQRGSLVLEWETTNLGSKVTSFFVRDLFKDGHEETVITTEAGRILIYDENYDLVWENLQDPFKKIDCMTAANIDHDPEDELIFVADSHLYIYDSLSKSLEWQSQRKFSAREILIANVDDDEQEEIILNSGHIIDSRFYNIEFEIEKSFGERISLFDINDDGIPEIFGEFSDFTLRVYDIYAEREIW